MRVWLVGLPYLPHLPLGRDVCSACPPSYVAADIVRTTRHWHAPHFLPARATTLPDVRLPPQLAFTLATSTVCPFHTRDLHTAHATDCGAVCRTPPATFAAFHLPRTPLRSACMTPWTTYFPDGGSAWTRITHANDARRCACCDKTDVPPYYAILACAFLRTTYRAHHRASFPPPHTGYFSTHLLPPRLSLPLHSACVVLRFASNTPYNSLPVHRTARRHLVSTAYVPPFPPSTPFTARYVARQHARWTFLPPVLVCFPHARRCVTHPRWFYTHSTPPPRRTPATTLHLHHPHAFALYYLHTRTAHARAHGCWTPRTGTRCPTLTRMVADTVTFHRCSPHHAPPPTPHAHAHTLLHTTHTSGCPAV